MRLRQCAMRAGQNHCRTGDARSPLAQPNREEQRCSAQAQCVCLFARGACIRNPILGSLPDGALLSTQISRAFECSTSQVCMANGARASLCSSAGRDPSPCRLLRRRGVGAVRPFQSSLGSAFRTGLKCPQCVLFLNLPGLGSAGSTNRALATEHGTCHPDQSTFDL